MDNVANMPKWIFRLPIGVSCKAHGVVWRGARRNAREWQKAVWQFCCAIRIIAGVWQGFQAAFGALCCVIGCLDDFLRHFCAGANFFGLGGNLFC